MTKWALENLFIGLDAQKNYSAMFTMLAAFDAVVSSIYACMLMQRPSEEATHNICPIIRSHLRTKTLSRVVQLLCRQLTVFENHPKCRSWILAFWHFPPIFVLLKLPCLVTLFDCKFQVFKNSPKWTIFGIFNYLLFSQNVTLARFARNVELDFFCDFQTQCRRQFSHFGFLVYFEIIFHTFHVICDVEFFPWHF